ncbi:hypothetical protein [Aurantivibrio infirmus]
MELGSVLQTGLNGLRHSQNEIAKSANDIVRAGTVDRDESTIIDIAEPIINMQFEQHVFDASAKLVKSADQMLGTILNIKT